MLWQSCMLQHTHALCRSCLHTTQHLHTQPTRTHTQALPHLAACCLWPQPPLLHCCVDGSSSSPACGGAHGQTCIRNGCTLKGRCLGACEAIPVVVFESGRCLVRHRKRGVGGRVIEREGVCVDVRRDAHVHTDTQSHIVTLYTPNTIKHSQCIGRQFECLLSTIQHCCPRRQLVTQLNH